eukprot:3128931-Amphidinium_carterae.1
METGGALFEHPTCHYPSKRFVLSQERVLCRHKVKARSQHDTNPTGGSVCSIDSTGSPMRGPAQSFQLGRGGANIVGSQTVLTECYHIRLCLHVEYSVEMFSERIDVGKPKTDVRPCVLVLDIRVFSTILLLTAPILQVSKDFRPAQVFAKVPVVNAIVGRFRGLAPRFVEAEVHTGVQHKGSKVAPVVPKVQALCMGHPVLVLETGA